MTRTDDEDEEEERVGFGDDVGAGHCSQEYKGLTGRGAGLPEVVGVAVAGRRWEDALLGVCDAARCARDGSGRGLVGTCVVRITRMSSVPVI